MINLAVFAFDHLLSQGWVQLLYLNHSAPQWWQFITSAFCHGSWQHLSSNLVRTLSCDVTKGRPAALSADRPGHESAMLHLMYWRAGCSLASTCLAVRWRQTAEHSA